MIDPTFSIIIPSYNEARHIRRCIESVRANDHTKTKYEIVVVDNGSTDGTREIVRGLGVSLLENTGGKRKSIAALRNEGARASRGEILAFLDADMVVPEEWLQKAKGYFCAGFEGALGFIEDVPGSAGWVGRVWGSPRRDGRRDKAMEVDFLPGRNLFINRHVFEKIRGFTESLITAEDKDLTLRVWQAGFRALSSPDTTVIHLGYERDLGEFIRKEFWRQGSSLTVAMQHGLSWRTLRHPFLSLFHISMLFIVVFSSLLLSLPVSLALLITWMLPSAVINLKKLSYATPFGFRIAFFFLTFLRWNVSGAAVLKQVVTLLSGRKNVKHK